MAKCPLLNGHEALLHTSKRLDGWMAFKAYLKVFNVLERFVVGLSI